VTITQSVNEPSSPLLGIKSGSVIGNINRANGTCSTFSNTIGSGTTGSSRTIKVTFNGVAVGSVFYVAIQFSTSAVIGESIPTPNSTVTYQFSTSGVPGSTSSTDLVIK
jgi:hypothetical protein